MLLTGWTANVFRGFRFSLKSFLLHDNVSNSLAQETTFATWPYLPNAAIRHKRQNLSALSPEKP